MPFGEHLEDLRRRLIYALWGILPIMMGALYIGKDLLGLLLLPVERALRDADLSPVLQATSPLETFMSYFKISLTVTIIVASPWILLQLWLFIAPGLYNNERRFAYVLAPLSIIMTVVGVTFCYKVMFPITLAFLIHFGSTIAPADVHSQVFPEEVMQKLLIIPSLPADPVDPPEHAMWYNNKLKQLRFAVGSDSERKKPIVLGISLIAGGAIAQQYRVSEYVGLLMGLCLAFAVAFQMPVAVLILGWANVVQIAFLTKYRRHALFVCAAIGALLTPTVDPFTMFLLAVPLYGLYELGIILLRVMPASRVAAGFKGVKDKEPDGDPDVVEPKEPQA